jgi:hypothetical protein
MKFNGLSLSLPTLSVATMWSALNTRPAGVALIARPSAMLMLWISPEQRVRE